MRHAILTVCWILACVCARASAQELVDIPHPFLLWTQKDLAELRTRATSDASTKAQIDRMLESEFRDKNPGANPSMARLFKFAVLGDKVAGEAEKKQLLGFIKFRMPENIPGDPNSRNAAYREDRTLDALRYDILYDELTPDERAGIEASAKLLIDHCLANPGPWKVGDPGLALGSRCGWLPNMQWPTMAGAHVWAVAIKDRKRIDAIFNASGGWKWYLDFYLADGRFYMEEFAKYYSNIGSEILWCNGLDRLGLNQYGWGYTGKGGATMQRHLTSLMDAALPQVPRASVPGAWDIPVTWMGDAGREWVVSGRTNQWNKARMNGAIPKMRQPLWWEAGAQRFPNQGFEFFLAKFASPDEKVFLPSLYFSQRAIDPKQAKPPAAPSSVNFERGFAILRAEESPAYWESPKPAVVLQFGMYYVHYIHDAFSILDFVANNRLIYDKVGRTGSSYAGGDSWRDHGRGQASAVVVDGLKAKPVDDGEAGCKNQRIRQWLKGPAKFTAVRANGIFPDVDQERALLLCSEYLFDATWLTSSTPRTYDWHVLTEGTIPAQRLAEWQPLAGPENIVGTRSLTEQAQSLSEPRVRDVGANPWTETLILPDVLPGSDAKNAVGVRVFMLGEAGSLLVTGQPPQPAAPKDKPPTPIVGTKLLITRQTANTCFAAVHEPLTGGEGASRIAEVQPLGDTTGGLAVKVIGKPNSGINDRIVMRRGDEVGKPGRYSADGEVFATSDMLWIRIGSDRVEAWGDAIELSVKVAGTPQLLLNGESVPTKVHDGVLTWKK